jgi:kynureninase
MARALVEIGKVIPDFRAPDNLRLGLSPLYTTHVEVHTAVLRLVRILEGNLYSGYTDMTLTVT